MRRLTVPALLMCLALCSCGKPDQAARNATDLCASAKGAPPYETDAQAIQACRDNKKFSGRDVKRSNVQITNH